MHAIAKLPLMHQLGLGLGWDDGMMAGGGEAARDLKIGLVGRRRFAPLFLPHFFTRYRYLDQQRTTTTVTTTEQMAFYHKINIQIER